MVLNHIWSFFCLLTAASAVELSYPSINSSLDLTCTCPDYQCQKVYWFRLLQGSDTPEFLVSTNMLNRLLYSTLTNTDENRFKPSVTSSSIIVYKLRITGIQRTDAGFYSCLLYSTNSAQDPKDLAPKGYYIRPGEIKSTLAPTTVKTHVNRHPNICKSHKGCKPPVLWSGVSAVLFLVVVLISTLYYFSRLPKKCRHKFVKKQQLR